MERETRKKLMEAITFIENTAQNQEVHETVCSNEWDFIETEARNLRKLIEELETEEEYNRRVKENALEES